MRGSKLTFFDIKIFFPELYLKKCTLSLESSFYAHVEPVIKIKAQREAPRRDFRPYTGVIMHLSLGKKNFGAPRSAAPRFQALYVRPYALKSQRKKIFRRGAKRRAAISGLLLALIST